MVNKDVYIIALLWPANSPDINVVDYKMCGVLQQRLYQYTVDKLRQHYGPPIIN